VPFKARDRYFFTSNSGHQDQSVLFMSDGLHAKPVVALDPNVLPGSGHPVVTGYVASRDGSLVAYGVSIGGSDWTDWHIRDLASGKDLEDVLRFTKYYHPLFTPDGKGLYYSAFPAPAAGAELSTQDRNNAVYYHALGTPSSADKRMLGDAAHPDWQYEPHLTPDGRWLVVLAGEGEVGDKGLEDVYVIDLKANAGAPVAVSVGFQAAFIYVGADAGRLFFLTSLQAPNGRVVALDPHNASRSWQPVIPEGTDAIDLGIASRSVTLVGHRLFVRTLHDAHSRVVASHLDGTQPREVPFAGPGTVTGFDGEPEDSETFFSYSNAITPPTVFRYEVESGSTSVFFSPRVAFDPKDFEQRQVFYSAKDGTRIPMLLAYRKGLRLSGDNPVLLYGYGGFGISLTPSFNPSRIAWLEMGGVLATANIRGGGEYGEAWHRQGTLAHKQVVFDDFIAAARWLIAERYTSSSRLAIQGASNGGLLVGACVTQQPQLFGAAIVQVGVLDMLRFNLFGQGAGWEGDYGSPQDPRVFPALRAYSPVHNVRPGTRYPAIMVITGDHDTRVMPMHSFKFAAALQAAQAGPAPVLLDVRLSSGHSGGETISQAVQQNADVYAFLAKNLHMVLR
jgi:prolyl oligopeptidase